MGDNGESKGKVMVIAKREVEVLDLDGPNNPGSTNPIQGAPSSSSQGHLKSYFVGMGFSPTIVDRVLEESGGREANVDLLLESLFAYSDIKGSGTGYPGNSDRICSHDSDESSSGFSLDGAELEEIDVKPEINEDKRRYLLTMKFSAKEVDFAIENLGESAQINELVDFIVAAQIAESSGKKEEESLFDTMDRTLRLLEMGFTEDEISSAIEKFGSDSSVQELADSIFAKRIADTYPIKQEDQSNFFSMHHSSSQTDPTSVESLKEEIDQSIFNSIHSSNSRNGWTSVESLRDEQAKRRSYEALLAETQASSSTSRFEEFDFNDIRKGKRAKYDYDDYLTFEQKPSSYPHRELYQSPEESANDIKMPVPLQPENRRLRQSLSKPPYFFYGNVLDISGDDWAKISNFLYAIAPEFVNTQFFSVLNRKEGYIHNLPIENRFHILPRPSMTIEDAFPQTKPWWPSWDTRKQFSSICSETRGISPHCERLSKILINSQGFPSTEQQMEILHHSKMLNLIWVGRYKLGYIGPEQVERIMGFPTDHTEILRYDDPAERLRSLKYSFQTDTLGYHLSVLKRIFPQGLTVLSLYSGLGGAEVALYRLGIRLKCVVSVEPSETNRKILKKWWSNTGQTGKLVQIEDISRMTSNKIESLMKDFGGFDFIFCQNPCPRVSENRIMTGGLDYSMFYEFVRVLQRVRGPARNIFIKL